MWFVSLLLSILMFRQQMCRWFITCIIVSDPWQKTQLQWSQHLEYYLSFVFTYTSTFLMQSEIKYAIWTFGVILSIFSVCIKRNPLSERKCSIFFRHEANFFARSENNRLSEANFSAIWNEFWVRCEANFWRDIKRNFLSRAQFSISSDNFVCFEVNI